MIRISAAFDAQEQSGLAATFTADMKTVDPIRRFVVVGDELVAVKVGHVGHQALGAVAGVVAGGDAGPLGLDTPFAGTPAELIALVEQDAQAVRIRLADVERCELRGRSWTGFGYFRLVTAGAKRKFSFTTERSSDVGNAALRDALGARVTKGAIF